jgi:hypothetical protein
MPVFEASYRRWDGKARASRRAAFAIAGTMIPRLFKLKLVRFPVLVLPLFATLLSGTIFYFSYGRIFQMVTERLEWGDFSLLNYVNQYFFMMARYFAIILAAVAGGPLIAEDRRARALPLYFARPITHLDYMLGKMLSVGTFVALLLFVPPIVMYLVDISLDRADDAWRTELPAFLGSLVPAVCGIVVLSSIALASSSLCERSQFGTFLCIALLMVSGFIGGTLAGVLEEPAFAMIAPTEALMRVAMDVVPVPVQVTPVDYLVGVDASAAWTSLAVWTAASLLVLFVRIRKVEVVT